MTQSITEVYHEFTLACRQWNGTGGISLQLEAIPKMYRVRHSRMLLAGIQGFGLDPRLKHSGVATCLLVTRGYIL